jgi:hypothetical protein
LDFSCTPAFLLGLRTFFLGLATNLFALPLAAPFPAGLIKYPFSLAFSSDSAVVRVNLMGFRGLAASGLFLVGVRLLENLRVRVSASRRSEATLSRDSSFCARFVRAFSSLAWTGKGRGSVLRGR